MRNGSRASSEKSPVLRNNGIPDIALLFIVAACVVLVFSRTANNFFLLDDGAWLERGKKGGENLKSIFQPVGGIYFEPVLNFIFSMNFLFFKLNPSGYYIFSMYIHLLNCMILYFLFLALFPGNKTGAFLSSALFAVMVAHHQAVFWISAFVHLVSATLYLLTLLLFIQHERTQNKTFYVLCVFSFFLCLLTKESTVSLPLVLAAYGICFQKNNDARAAWKKLLPFLSLSLCYMLFFQLWKGFTFQTKYGGTGFAIGTHFLPILVSSFLEIFLTTLGLVSFAGKYTGMQGFLLNLILAAGILLFALVYAKKGSASNRENGFFAKFFFGLIFFLCSFALFSFFRELLGYGSFHRYRYFYLPSAGFCLSFGYLFSFLWTASLKKTFAGKMLWTSLLISIFYLNVLHTVQAEKYYSAYGDISKTTVQQIGYFIRNRKPAKLYLADFPQIPVLALGEPHIISLVKLYYGSGWNVLYIHASDIKKVFRRNETNIYLIYRNGNIIQYAGGESLPAS